MAKEYDHLFKLLIIGDSGKYHSKVAFSFFYLAIFWTVCSTV